ncbi:LysR family transcriptional regulator [Paenibacillus tepidiphilus]|uniref:LysR family transcriptional regulator n=1 Tax=Paenibacillus tepidiphilus TaxID=2608683 RepID=UPI00123AF648|nr:LysR family transcriptional regulator [Paenibacillus tepidiphilus]
MDVKALKTFQLIVKHGSFVRAADELNYAQSTVTMQIQKLEAELGTALLTRGKELGLTEAGRLLYEQSLPMLKNMEQLENNLKNLATGESGHVRIGVTEPTASYRLPAMLKAFLSENPGIRVSLEIASTAALADSVAAGRLDFAVCTSPGLQSELFFEPWFQEEFIALLPSDHPLAGREVITAGDLTADRLLITAAGCPYRRKLEMVLQETGNIQLDTMEIGSMTALKYYVESGLGIALVPRIMAERDGISRVEVRALSGTLIGMTSGVLGREAAYPFPPAAHKCLDYLKSRLAQPGKELQ